MSLLVVEDLVKDYGSVTALQGVSLALEAGEVFGLVGPDGAGKTSLIRIVAGLLQASSGSLRRSFTGTVGYIAQRFALYRDLTVEENVGFFADVYGLRNYGARRDALLEQIGLAPFRKRLAEQLSGGMKQKLALCCSLIHEPGLLLMDEPTTGVDPVSRREFWSIVFHLQRQGLTVLSSTPYMDEAEQFDRIALLHEGRILRMGTPDEVKASVPGTVLAVLVEDPYQAREVLRNGQVSQEVELFGDSLHVVLPPGSPVTPAQICSLLQDQGLAVRQVRPVDFSIEDVFLKVAQ
ncbi:MAG: ABC transporter ATP-binding protein [Candidatus Eremiobacteraeota bacterium]|nr:ABC transporter ATP-binding protein [Candidatus Eremiobacteraeota bacterium]MCW5868929.1 ABC transporter ATP-binding protein [Candidatus Eremiobacteraeota bacterium]